MLKSSSCSLRDRCVPCSLVLKVELVPPSLLRSSDVPSSFWSVSQCLSWQSICINPLYVLEPLFVVLFYFLYYVLCFRLFPEYIDSFLYLILLFPVSVSKISSALLLNVGLSSIPVVIFIGHTEHRN